jgi:hypothetical protein
VVSKLFSAVSIQESLIVLLEKKSEIIWMERPEIAGREIRGRT